MTKAELLQCIKALEQGAPAVNIAFEHERLLHDLQVHQIELETQNREQIEAQLLLEASRDRYADLYDFAPVGYLTLNDKGIIQEINLTAAGMLGGERTRLVGVPFHLHIAREDLALFREHLRRHESTEDRVVTELRLARRDATTVPIVMQSVLVYDVEKKTHLCRAALTDITERKQAELAAQESAELNQGILSSLSAHIAVLDKAGNIIAVNDAWNRFARENGDRDLRRTGVGTNYLDACLQATGIAKVDGLRAREGIQSVLKGTQPGFGMDYRCDSPSEKRWFQMSVTPLSAGGRGAVISHLDISDLRLAEADLSEKEARLRAVLDTAVEGIITIDERGTIESLNQAAVDLFGYQAHEAVGQNVSLLMPSPHREQHDRYLANYRATGERKIIGIGREVSGQRKDGSTFPVDLSVSEVQLQGRRIFTGFVRDITPRKEAERLLMESEQRYRTLVEASPDAILVLKHGRIDFINPQGLRLLGAQSAAEVVGRSPFDFVARDRHAVLRERVVEAKPGGGASPVIEEEFLRSDGSRRWVSLSSVMFAEHGETAVQLILRDITERKQLETEILEISEREQRRLGHDLHDGLGQRLTGLEMLSHGLAEDLKGTKPALAQQARRLNRELRETVTEARLISHSLAPVPLSGDGLMRGLSELASSTGRLPGVKCRLSCSPPSVFVKDATTATHLYRIAQEAVNNALKHGRAKRIEIVLKEEAGVVELSVQNNGRRLPIRSKSCGVGLNVMRYRAATIGASLSVKSAGRKGVKVTCVLRKT